MCLGVLKCLIITILVSLSYFYLAAAPHPSSAPSFFKGGEKRKTGLIEQKISQIRIHGLPMHFVSFLNLTIRTLAKIHKCFVGRRIRSENLQSLMPSLHVRDEGDKKGWTYVEVCFCLLINNCMSTKFSWARE